MNLFMTGDFTLRSGKKSRWKIECDALTKEDWAGLAAMAAEIIPPFGGVLGVPKGGIPFADALRRYATERQSDPLLIAEDVCTTGGSMVRYVKSLNISPDMRYYGVCVFAREEEWPTWVRPLFAFNPVKVMIRVAREIAAKSKEE